MELGEAPLLRRAASDEYMQAEKTIEERFAMIGKLNFHKEVSRMLEDGRDIVYVKKWMRTRHAIMFRLSNKVVQVNF